MVREPAKSQVPVAAVAEEGGGWGVWAWVGVGGLAAVATGGGGGGSEGGDAVAPTLIGSTPNDNATAVLIGSNIVLTFSETVVAGSGNIVIRNGVDTRVISVSDSSQITISANTVTISPTTDLQSSSTYNVQMASGVIRDSAGNVFAGISGSAALDFTTTTSGVSAVDLSAVASGIGGFVINGQAAFDKSGESVSSAGDVNGDGLADLLVGAYRANPAAGADAGRSYVIFGNTTGAFAQTSVDQYGTTGADSFTDAGKDLFLINATMITALQSAYGSGGNTNQLSRIDGGTGLDTISLTGSGLTFDLTQIANQAASNPDGGSRIDSIERINITGNGGDNTLLLTLADVLDMGSANTFLITGRQQLMVVGDSGDTLDLADATGTTNWTQAGTEVIAFSSDQEGASLLTYNVWNHDTALATVYVNTSVSVI